MEQLSRQEGGAENISAASVVSSDTAVLGRRIAFLAALAVLGVKPEAQAQQRGGPKSGKKPVAAESIYLSCPEKEAEKVEGEDVAVPDECRDGRLEVRCPRPKVAAAWDIPSMSLPGGSGVSLPLRLLQGNSIFVGCEGDGRDGGRILDIPPATKVTTFPRADSAQVNEHPEVKEAEIKFLAAKQRLTDAETQTIRTGRDLLLARGKLDSAKKRFELHGAANTLIAVKAAEEEYIRALGVRQKAKAEYESAQAEFDRSVEQYAAAVQHVLSGLKLEALRASPARMQSDAAKAKTKTTPLSGSKKPGSSSHRSVALSGGASGSLFSMPDHFVDSPGFFLEGDMRGLFAGRPAVGVQIGARYTPLLQHLSDGDPRFAPLDSNRRLPGFLATLDARVQRDFPLGRFGSADVVLRPSVGFGAGVLRVGRGVDAGVSRANQRDLADVPQTTKVFPMTVAGARIVLTRDRISGAIGIDGMLSAIPTQGRAGAPDDRRNLIGDVAATASAGYEF